jgi:hypothetical protein
MGSDITTGFKTSGEPAVMSLLASNILKFKYYTILRA